MQTIGADQKAIRGEQVEVQGVHPDPFLDTNGAGDDVLVLGGAGFVLGDHAALELFVDQGMIDGELVYLILAHQVDAGVAHMTNESAVVGDE